MELNLLFIDLVKAFDSIKSRCYLKKVGLPGSSRSNHRNVGGNVQERCGVHLEWTKEVQS